MNSHFNFLKLGLVGWPLEHSLSPRMHNAALQTLGLAGEYRLYPIPPLPEGITALSELLDRMRQGELKGLNVTIPHKQNVLSLLDEMTPAAQAIGAVNMIYFQGKHLTGNNTDAPGFLADLTQVFPSIFQKPASTALVLGAGGSARAVVYALAQAGWQVMVAARRVQQAEELAASLTLDRPTSITLSTSRVTPLQLQESTFALPFSLLVNTTPLGMFPNIDPSPWPGRVLFPADAAVYDLVYNPPETALLRAARIAGLPTANGLGMLFEQAVVAFETWTGRPAPREAMRNALALDQEKR
jgi:shikimate dehydrogenase